LSDKKISTISILIYENNIYLFLHTNREHV